MRRVVVAGSGLVGSALIEQACALGHEVLVLARSQDTLDRVPPEATRVQGAVGDGSLAATVRDGDLVLLSHGAASPRASGDAEATLLANVDRTVADVEHAVNGRQGLDVICFSSGGAVYGPSADPVTESAELAPTSAYGRAKSREEQSLLDLNSRDGVAVTALRVSTVFGLRPGGSVTQGLVQIAADRLRSGQPVSLFGRGLARRGYVWNRDLAKLVLRLGDAERQHAVYNVCSEQYLSGVEVVRVVAAAIGCDLQVENIDADDRDMLVSAQRLQHEFPTTFTGFAVAVEAVFSPGR